MQCPICDVNLMIADRQGIEIDFCPKCRGIWLDRGELDKLVERSEAPIRNYEEYQSHTGQYPRPGLREVQVDPRSHHKHKRKSFLEEIFDFD